MRKNRPSLLCVLNVNNCKPARLLLGCQLEVRTVEEMALFPLFILCILSVMGQCDTEYQVEMDNFRWRTNLRHRKPITSDTFVRMKS